jgi:hypothetical protein
MAQAATAKPKKKAYVLVFIAPGEKLPDDILRDCDLEMVELPMAKFADLENSYLIDIGNKANKLSGILDKWLKTMKEVLKTRYELPTVGEYVVAVGSRAQALISTKSRASFNKDKFIELYGAEALADVYKETEYTEIRLTDIKEG